MVSDFTFKRHIKGFRPQWSRICWQKISSMNDWRSTSRFHLCRLGKSTRRHLIVYWRYFSWSPKPKTTSKPLTLKTWDNKFRASAENNFSAMFNFLQAIFYIIWETGWAFFRWKQVPGYRRRTENEQKPKTRANFWPKTITKNKFFF